MVTALAMHPAARRRLTERMPQAHRHEVDLRPLGGAGAGEIVGAREQDFIAAVLADIAGDGWRSALAQRRDLRRNGDVLELTHPVHRRFHLVLYELTCRQPGSPPVDPRTLDGMGLVLRRRRKDAWLGWMSDGPAKRGWTTPLPGDPDPGRRSPRRAGSPGAIDALLADRRGISHWREDVSPLFVAPPDVCKARGRTILYGLVPLASSEHSETPKGGLDYNGLAGQDRTDIVGHLSGYLKPRASTSMPFAGQPIVMLGQPLRPPLKTDVDNNRLRKLALLAQQLSVECDAFGDGAQGLALIQILGEIDLPMERDVFGATTLSMSAAAFLTKAAPLLLGDGGGDPTVTMPLAWPTIDAALGNRLTEAALSCLTARFATIGPQKPKFDGPGALYAVRAFIRVRGPDECQPKLAWSPYSAPFRILPWWDGDGPPARIALPNLSDLRRVKPNVSFELPPSLAGLLNGDMKKLSDGEEPGGGGIGIFWLCSFSIPIITLCAFICLNIFLTLFDIVFSWMAWFKICLPIPVPKDEP